MPRQIIDTESSRPAYVRRQVATFVAIAVVVIVAAGALWAAWPHILHH
jgi:beta-lactamase regulating signal transducer with metallopeptidase domain